MRQAGSILLGRQESDDPIADDLTRPGALIEEAVTDLTRCGSAADVYVVAYGARERGRELGKELPEAFATSTGQRSQTQFARNCILFSALGAEAYVNAFLDGRVTGSDLDALDRLPTVEKYVVGVTYAEGEAVFDRGAEPIQTLKRLFSTRDALVHPKPGRRAVVTPEAAAEFLVAAAVAAQRLIERAGAGEVICKEISDYPIVYIDWGKRWTGKLPPIDAETPRNLAAVAAEKRRGKSS
ncbi:MAG: hypothetical protein ACTHM1_09395 [Solirubrobacteraceae bacterium]